MNGTRLLMLALITLLPLLGATHAQQQDVSTPNAAHEVVDLLSVGKRYRIIFPDTFPLFSHRTEQVTQSTVSRNGKVVSRSPVSWGITLKCEYFVVTQLGPRDWIQVEHPSDHEDYSRWAGKLIAQQAIDQKIVKPDAKSANKERAAEVVSTSKTWINLDRVLAIQEVPPQFPKPKASVKVSSGRN